jgi:pyruvate-formate lyase-activating enzyme
MIAKIKRLESEFYGIRFPLYMRDKKYSAIIFDGCNFNCYFCFESDKDPDGTVREKLGIVSLKDLKRFVAEELEKGNPIEITGGEPTLYPDIVLKLLKFIKSKNGFVCLATNGSKPNVVDTFAPYLDVLGLDIKSTKDKIDVYVDVDKKLSFDLPLETLKRSKRYNCDVHFKRILFDSTTLKELEYFYPYASHTYWILKQLRPFPKRKRTFKHLSNASIKPIPNEKMNQITKSFIDNHPDLKGRLVSICGGSGRNPHNYTYW